MSILDKMKSITSSLTGVPQKTSDETLVSEIESGQTVIDKTSKETAEEDASTVVSIIADDKNKITVPKIGQPESPYDDALVNYMACGRITDSTNLSYGYGRIEGVGNNYYWDCLSNINYLKVVVNPCTFIIYGREVRITEQEVIYENDNAIDNLYGCLCINVDLTEPVSQSAKVYFETATGSYPIIKEGDNLINVEGGIATIVIGRCFYSSSEGTADVYDTAHKIVPGHADSSRNLESGHSINGTDVDDLINSEGVFYFCDLAQEAGTLLNAVKTSEMIWSYGDKREIGPISYLGSTDVNDNQEGLITEERIITLSEPIYLENVIGFRFFLGKLSSSAFGTIEVQKQFINNTYVGSDVTVTKYYEAYMTNFDKTVIIPADVETMSNIDWKYSNFISKKGFSGDPTAEKNIDTTNGYSMSLFVSEYGTAMSSQYTMPGNGEITSSMKISQVELLGMNGIINQVKISVYRYAVRENSFSYSTRTNVFSMFRSFVSDGSGGSAADGNNSLRLYIQPIYKTN